MPTPVFLARARVAARTRIPAHWHIHDTIACLVEGRALLRSGDGMADVHEMSADDWLFVPAGLVHAEENPDDVHGDFLYARDGAGRSTTYVSDEHDLNEAVSFLARCPIIDSVQVYECVSM